MQNQTSNFKAAPLQKTSRTKSATTKKSNGQPKVFFESAIFLALLTGLIIPSAVISASPQEFVLTGYLNNPLWYLVSSSCLAIGTFVIWFGIFYSLADGRTRKYVEQAMWVLCGIAIINYMFFGTDMGLISSTLQYEDGMNFSKTQQLINFAILLLVAGGMWFLGNLLKKRKFDILTAASLALCVLAVVNISNISTSVSGLNIPENSSNAAGSESSTQSSALHSLSKNGQNVVVLMLDRGMSEYIPYIMQENAELKEKFDGFTFYSNTISFGPYTNFGTPGVFGGYEYTPAENNKRNSETLESKQNEALKVMPSIFSQNGYKTTVCQPSYAGYQETPDLSIFDDCPNVNAYNTSGMFSSEEEAKPVIEANMRNFFAFGITKISPLCLQPKLYEEGLYNYATKNSGEFTFPQTIEGFLNATGVNEKFLKSYNTLNCMTSVADVADSSENTFLMMSNEATHEPCMLQLPTFTPEENVDNSAYAGLLENIGSINGQSLKMENELQVEHYQINMASLLKLGEWFDYLREQGVWDNTKIIIVSDHGRGLAQLDEAMLTLEDGTVIDSEWYRALLMVKDFNASGFNTSDEFMTNANTPTLAFANTIKNPVNPFTGKAINSAEKTAHDQYILESQVFNVATNNGNVFLPGDWYAVHGNTWDASNWKLVAKNSTLPE